MELVLFQTVTAQAEENVTFIHGDNPDKGFHYQNGNLEITGLADAKWEQLGYGNYTKTVNAEITNSIDEDATMDIPVEKIWRDGNYNARPESVTIQLYKQVDDTEQPVNGQILTLQGSNDEKRDWKGSFNDLPCWEEGADVKLQSN